MITFADVKPGDRLTRMLGGRHGVACQVIVGEVKDGIIRVGSADGVVPWQIGWRFRVDTGCEVDEDLGWDGVTTTGSYLAPEGR